MSLREELTELSRVNHTKFLELGQDFLSVVSENENPLGRIKWDVPCKADGTFVLESSSTIRVFNHVLAFLVALLSIEAQEMIGVPALSKKLDHEKIIAQWKNYQRDFGSKQFIAKKLREVAALRGRQGEGRSQDVHNKAARTIETSEIPIESGKDAEKLRGVGPKIAAKIDELLNTGKISILEAEKKVLQEIEMLKTIWGVNTATANLWHDIGYRSIDDIRDAVERGDVKPTKLQAMGLKYYDDFQMPLTAQSVNTVGKLVRIAAGHSRETMIVGSFRRKVYDPILKVKRPGNEIAEFRTKDVDILIVDDDKHHGTLKEIIAELEKVASVEFAAVGEHQCMGAILVPSLGKFKRIDIFVCTSEELPCALLAHTGPAGYNVQMRQVANEKGWTLNEHHLKDEKDNIIETKTEADVQRLLGFPEAQPFERK